MAWYWWLLESSANLVEAIMMVAFIQQFSEQRRKSLLPQAIAVACIFLMVTAFNHLDWFNITLPEAAGMPLTIMLYVGMGVAVGFAVYRGNVFSRLLLPMILVAMIFVTEWLTYTIVQLVFPNQSQMEPTSARMLGIMVSKPLLILLVLAAKPFSRKDRGKVPLGFGLAILVVPVISIVFSITLLQYIVNSDNSIISPYWFALSSVGMLFMSLFVLALFQAFMNYSDRQRQLQLMLQQAELLNNHLSETNALQSETQRIWHDMKNHFAVVQWMVKTKEYEKLDRYMQTLNDAVTASMPKFQTGNQIVDALLNAKTAEARNSGVEFNVNAILPGKLPIDDMDLNIVLSNALDNALDACKKLPEGVQRFIDFDASVKNDHLVLNVQNPYSGKIKESGGVLISTKADAKRHGIGIGNMKRAVEKYDGHILSDYADNVFRLTAVMRARPQVLGEPRFAPDTAPLA